MGENGIHKAGLGKLIGKKLAKELNILYGI